MFKRSTLFLIIVACALYPAADKLFAYGSQKETLVNFTKLKNAGKKEEAVQVLKAHLETEPDWYYGNLYLGKFYYDEGEYGESLPFLQKAKEINPVSFGPCGKELGTALLAQGRNEDAIKAYEEAKEFLDPAEREEMEMVLWKGYYKCGDYEKALSHFERFTYRFSDSYEDMKMAGEMYLKLGRELDAKNAFETALRLNPEDGEIEKLLADLHIKTSSAEGLAGKRETLSYWKDRPDEEKTPEILEKLGKLAAELNDEELAKEYFGRLLEADPGNCEAHLWFARHDLEAGRYGGTLKHSKKVVECPSEKISPEEKQELYIISGKAHWGLAKERYKRVKGADLKGYKALVSEYYRADGKFRKAHDISPNEETRKLIKQNSNALTVLKDVVKTLEEEIRDQKKLERILELLRRELE